LWGLNIVASKSALLKYSNGTEIWSKDGSWTGSENVTIDISPGEVKNLTFIGVNGSVSLKSYIRYTS